MNELGHAIYLPTLYVFTNIFLCHTRKIDLIADVNSNDSIVREFNRVMNKRHPNEPRLYYGTKY